MRNVELAGCDALGDDIRDHPLLLVPERDVPFPVAGVEAADLAGGDEGLLPAFQVEAQEASTSASNRAAGEPAFAPSSAAVVRRSRSSITATMSTIMISCLDR
jgi:hypothetical protein